MCSIDGCGDASAAKGFCNVHYLRLRTKGTPDPPVKPSMEERFWAKVEKTDECWVWTGALDPNGYGMFNKHPKVVRAHTVAYELIVGEVPDGLVLDHLCRNTSCCNPKHLDPVPHRVNILRGVAPMIRAHVTNTCQRGHSLEDAYVRPDTGHRQCRPCMRMREQRRRRRAA